MHISDVIQSLAALVGAFGVSGFLWKIVPLFLDRKHLFDKYQAAERRAELAESTLKAFEDAARGWELVRDEMASLRSQFGSAVLYISDLVVHIRDGGPPDEMPPIPADLQEAVNQSLRNREGSSV